MPRSRFCRACKEFHELDQPWPPSCASHFGTVGADAGFYVQTDTIDAFRSMADGKIYDSKSQYRRDLKARGLVEVGNDRVERRPTAPPPVRDALRQAYQQWRS